MFGLDFPDALELRDTKSSIPALPVVVSRLADAVVAAYVGDFHPGIGFLEDRHNLALREFAFLHG